MCCTKFAPKQSFRQKENPENRDVSGVFDILFGRVIISWSFRCTVYIVYNIKSNYRFLFVKNFTEKIFYDFAPR